MWILSTKCSLMTMSVQNAAASQDNQPSVRHTAAYNSPDFPRQAFWSVAVSLMSLDHLNCN